MYEGWSFTKRSEWLRIGDFGIADRDKFTFGTCTTVVIADSDSYNNGVFDIVLVKSFFFF